MPEALVDQSPAPITIPIDPHNLDAMLDKEWLLTNRIGAYSSSSAVGCNTRRYHGLLVASTIPPVGRFVALSTVMEQLTLGDVTYDLATNEFSNTFSPRGVDHLAEFRDGAAATFVYRFGSAELVKQVVLADHANAVAVRYTLRGGAGTLRLWPFVALRDFHGLRKVHQPHRIAFATIPGGVAVEDHVPASHAVHMVSREAVFEPKPQWWYRFCYRAEIARGQEGFEDLYTPGNFVVVLGDGGTCQFTASLDEPAPVEFAATLERRTQRQADLARTIGPGHDAATRRLAQATDAYLVERKIPNAPPSTTVLAGYHWFADWGRDTFIALPGLLLCTRRFDVAREVFSTFAGSISQGMIPNRFDDYGGAPHYNSIDASLWFILAAERYVRASGDTAFWQSVLMPAADRILTAYHDGTQFDIHADSDGLLAGGSHRTQLTWMDVALGEEVVTPRNGKAVEVNALWHCAHRIVAARAAGIDDAMARHYAHRADLIGPAFVRAFWNEQAGCLCDCVTDNQRDASIRPNQILAVSLPHPLLSAAQEASLVRVVTQHLLTPYGLRTLSPVDSRYRRQYGASWESRDRAYHQGTVWAWLIGPYIEAYLKVENYSAAAVAKAKQMLSAFDKHLEDAGLGHVNEIFDGDAPHTPRGCIAQAWSVAEVLRAKMLVAAREKAL